MGVRLSVHVFVDRQEVSPKGQRAIFERFRGILHEGVIDKRVQYTIENLFAVSSALGLGSEVRVGLVGW